MNPIWKDYYLNLGTAETINYRVVANADDEDLDIGTVIYTGRAYKRPGAAQNTIRINDIIADYMADIDNRIAYPMAFAVDTISGSRVTRRLLEEFSWDWSYDDGFSPDMEELMSFPITRKLHAGQLFLQSYFSGETKTLVYTMADGTTEEASAAPTQRTDNDFYNVLTHSAPTIVASLPLEAVAVEVDGKSYDIVSCGEAVLYYENAYGGWDSLLIEGRVKESANVQRRELQTEYDNRSPLNRGLHNYLNEMEEVVSLVTGWLSDAESARMMHLMHSTNVYLHLLGEDTILPVVLTDTATEKKTYKGNGCQLVNYTITAKVARDKIRR